MKKAVMGFCLVAVMGLSACETWEASKRDIGGLLGGIIGGVAGSQVGDGKGQLVAVGVGTFVGAIVGSEVGKSLDRADAVYAEQANQQAHNAPVGETVNWNNPETGNSGTVTPLRDGYDRNSGAFCREYEQTITVDGQQATGVGVACKQPDGRWEIMN